MNKSRWNMIFATIWMGLCIYGFLFETNPVHLYGPMILAIMHVHRAEDQQEKEKCQQENK